MTNRLHDALSDLVEEVPEHVVRESLPDTAWAAGRRRRWRRRAGVGAAALAVLAVVGQGLQPATEWARTVQPADSGSSPAVDGYPQRIGHQWWVRDLPDRPGPMAGIFVRSSGETPGPSDETWVAVSATGHQWRIPTAQGGGANAPTLSSTGRYLGYFPHRYRPPYVVHDLVTGERTVLRDVWPHAGVGHPNMVHAQTPSFWAADDSRAQFYLISGPVGDNLLLTPQGEKAHIRVGRYPAGWIGSDRLAFMSYDERDRGGVLGARVAVVDSSGAVQRTVDLDLPAAFRQTDAHVSQWSAVVSPDGRSVALVLEDFMDEAVYRFSMEDGHLTAGPDDVQGPAAICPLGWRGDRPVVATYPDRADGAVAVIADETPQAMVVSEPGLGISCLTLAASAADGTPHGLLGTSTGWWTWWAWWWKEIVLAGVAVALLVVVRPRLAGWARRRRAPSSDH